MGTRAITTAEDAKRMSAEDFDQVLATFGDSPSGLRNRALVLVLADCGLRVAEAVALGTDDLVRQAGHVSHVIIRRGKGGKPGQGAVTQRVGIALALWCEARAKLGIGDGPLFCTVSKGKRQAHFSPDGGELVPGKALSTTYVRNFVKQAGQAAGLDVDLHPHLLRHWAVTRFLRSSGNLELTRKFARHARIGTTVEVYSHLGQEDVDQAVARMDATTAAPDLAAVLAGLTPEQKKALAAALLAGGE